MAFKVIVPGVVMGLASAALFGANTPFAKLLLGDGFSPWLLAGLLYLGSGVGVGVGLNHGHTHDAHHQHDHGPGDLPGDRHDHAHRHAPLMHRHPHYPDLHHRHGHTDSS